MGISFHSIRSFEDELKSLKSKVIRMGQAVGQLLLDALDSLEQQNETLAKKAIEADRGVNLMEYDIENKVVRILALRQPVAHDLRSTIIAIKIASDLERMGDLAKGIAKKAVATLGQFELERWLVHKLIEMGHFANIQLNDVLHAYENHAQRLAFEIWQKDSQLDTMNEATFQALMQQMGKDSKAINTCTHFLFVAKSVERIGDHVCNIAELIHYQATGLWSTDEWTPLSQAHDTTSMR